MNNKMRFFTAVGFLTALICVATSCGPQSAPGNNQNAANTAVNSIASNARSTATTSKCEVETVRKNILTMINNSHSTRLQYINVDDEANVVKIWGYTAPNTTQHGDIIRSANLLIANGGCEGQVRLDIDNFFDGQPPEKHPMLRLANNACASGYKPCGAICILDPPDTCYIRDPGSGNMNVVPTRTPTPTP